MSNELRTLGGDPVDIADQIRDLRTWAETGMRNEGAGDHSRYVAACASAVLDLVDADLRQDLTDARSQLEACADELAGLRKLCVDSMQTIVRVDKTSYEHHEPRRWDGALPSEAGGTIWLTPGEIARATLRRLGAEVPDALKDSLARPVKP